MDEAIYETCVDLLHPIWRGIDADFKSQYPRIWQMFEGRVRIAANQNGTLTRFISQLCRSMGSHVTGHDELARIEEIVSRNVDGVLMRALREDTPYIIMLLRLRVQQIREEMGYE